MRHRERQMIEGKSDVDLIHICRVESDESKRESEDE